MWLRTDQRGDAGDEDRAGIGQRHVGQVLGRQHAGRRSAPIVAHARRRLFDHHPGRPPRIAPDPPQLDAFTRQRVEDAIARRVHAQAADPGDLQSEPGQPHTGIALGAGVIDEQCRRRTERFAGRGRQSDHRLADRDEIEGERR